MLEQIGRCKLLKILLSIVNKPGSLTQKTMDGVQISFKSEELALAICQNK